MALTGSEITQAQIGLLSAEDATDADLVKVQVALKRYKFTTAADLTGTNAIELAFDKIPNGQTGGINVTSVTVLPSAALTASAGNYATLTVEQNDAAGGTKSGIATINTTPTASSGTGNWTAYSKFSIPVTAASSAVAAGNMLIFKVAKTGSGVTVPAGTTILVDGYPV